MVYPFHVGDIQDGVARLIDPAHTIPVMVAMVLAFLSYPPHCLGIPMDAAAQEIQSGFCADPARGAHVTIALVVFLVKGSLALAFSLAGIVAAVRFRTSLDEPIDAVYMFMAIGIGLAAGTQLTTVAYLASLMFVAISLGVWKINFGAKPAVLSGWRIVPPEEGERRATAAAATRIHSEPGKPR